MPDSARRLNYHFGLFLEDTEFTLEQEYHTLLRRRLNYAMFSPGIVKGLELNYNVAAASVTVGKGVAVDNEPTTRLARELIVASDYPLSVSGLTGDVYIVLSYTTRDGAIKPTSTKPATIIEVASIDPVESTSFTPDKNSKIVLGKITIGSPLPAATPERQVARINSDILPVAGAPQPAITGFTPPHGPAGSEVVITGTNLTRVTDVTFGPTGGLFNATGISYRGRPGNPPAHLDPPDDATKETYFSILSDYQIVATVPDITAGTSMQIRVVSLDGTTVASASNFTVDPTPAKPAVQYLSYPDPDGTLRRKRIGEELLIPGLNLVSRIFVTFNYDSSENQLPDARLIKVEGKIDGTNAKVVVPHGAITGRFFVKTPGGQILSDQPLQIP